MAKSRIEMQTDEEAELQAERDRFEELADQYRQQGHLPPGGDQSWREREAMRLAAYGSGYPSPQNDQSWREREAMLFAPVREEETAGTMADESLQTQEPILRPVSAAKGGQGGTVLIFLLVAAIALGIAALAYPEMFTAGYWRAQDAPAATPASPPAVQPPPVRPTAPPLEQPPPSTPAPELKRAPAEPAPPAQEAPPLVIDAAPKPLSAPGRDVPRASTRDDRGTSGFYAKVPGPDGTLRETFFPADPKSDSRMPARKEPAVPPARPDGSGFYAKAPGPDGTMELRYFPRLPPPPR